MPPAAPVPGRASATSAMLKHLDELAAFWRSAAAVVDAAAVASEGEEQEEEGAAAEKSPSKKRFKKGSPMPAPLGLLPTGPPTVAAGAAALVAPTAAQPQPQPAARAQAVRRRGGRGPGVAPNRSHIAPPAG